jgi:hypothetical protein
MLEILEFIFSSLTHFFGTVFLLMIISRWNIIKVVYKTDSSLLERLTDLSDTLKKDKPDI